MEEATAVKAPAPQAGAATTPPSSVPPVATSAGGSTQRPRCPQTGHECMLTEPCHLTVETGSTGCVRWVEAVRKEAMEARTNGR